MFSKTRFTARHSRFKGPAKKPIIYDSKVNLSPTTAFASELDGFFKNLNCHIEFFKKGVLAEGSLSRNQLIGLDDLQSAMKAISTIVKQCTRHDCLKIDRVMTRDLIEEAVAFVKPQAGLSNINIVVNGEGRGPTLVINKARVFHILVNLLDNAIEAMGSSAEKLIGVNYSVCDKVVEILVSDSGNGISPENVEQIFKPLFSTKTIAGSGFGLALCRQFALEHGGNVELVSLKYPTAFRLRIPVLGSD